MSNQGRKLFEKALRPPPLPSNVILNMPPPRIPTPCKPSEDKENISDNRLVNHGNVKRDSNCFPKSSSHHSSSSKAVLSDSDDDVKTADNTTSDLPSSDDMSKDSNFGLFDASIDRSNLPMILSNCCDVEIDQTMKLLIVGNAKCGKSSIIARYAMNSFQESYKTTIGADFVRKDLTLQMHDGQILGVRLQLWDIAGQDRFQKMTRAYFAKAKGVVIVCDVSREGTVEAIKNWKTEINNCTHITGAEDIPVILFANKADLLSDAQDAFRTGATMERSTPATHYITTLMFLMFFSHLFPLSKYVENKAS